MNRITALNLTLCGLALAGLAGCAVGPDYKQPEQALPASWHHDADTPAFQPAQPGDAQLKGEWWRVFGDEGLNRYEQMALDHNQTLAVAVQRLQQAQLQLTATSSVQYPTVDAMLSDARSKTSADRPLAAYGVPNQSVVQNNPQLGLAVSYEADLFGRVRRVVEGARAAADQAAADFENARLVLLSDLATSYFSLRELDAETDIVQQSVVLQQKALDFIQTRRAADYATGLDVAQQEALLESSQTQLTLLKSQRAALQNAIATLTGQPAPDFRIDPVLQLPAAPALPELLPSQVLQRRPDVASAERAMAVANANIGVAKAAWYPSVMLQAGGGYNSNRWSNLISAPSLMWSLGASMTEHLFDAGRTTANVRIAEAGYTAAVATYRQNVLVALQEVQTGLDATAALQAATRSADAAAASSQRALDIANARYSGGIDIYLNVITAQQTQLGNQRQAVQLHGQQLANAVYLVKALGGGWQ